ncbi:hypothetical protein EVAR_3666_1 [Eumeta japonica]|uniref:Uncharacterized protein n=1 Tax=Eumeta variegata TaxID=151549 RepID=A0A4C1SS27_EUMVA|nr:hypothetical protein EVAR_3666_1 [Eumeta japonica]
MVEAAYAFREFRQLEYRSFHINISVLTADLPPSSYGGCGKREIEVEYLIERSGLMLGGNGQPDLSITRRNKIADAVIPILLYFFKMASTLPATGRPERGNPTHDPDQETDFSVTNTQTTSLRVIHVYKYSPAHAILFTRVSVKRNLTRRITGRRNKLCACVCRFPCRGRDVALAHLDRFQDFHSAHPLQINL